MTREQLKEKLELLLRSKDTIGELHFLIEKEGQLEIKKGDVEGTLQETLSNEFLNYAINYFSNENLEIMKLSEADERKDVLYLYDYEEPIDDFEYIKTVRENDSYEEYNFKKDDISNIKGYLVTYVNENIKLTVYKQHYAIFVLKKDSNLLLKWIGYTK